MKEREGLVTLKGNKVVLLGEEVLPGQNAPDFACVDNDLKTKSLADFAGKTIIISSVPSLLVLQVKHYNQVLINH